MSADINIMGLGQVWGTQVQSHTQPIVVYSSLDSPAYLTLDSHTGCTSAQYNKIWWGWDGLPKSSQNTVNKLYILAGVEQHELVVYSSVDSVDNPSHFTGIFIGDECLPICMMRPGVGKES